MTFVGFAPRQASAGIGLRHAHYSEFLLVIWGSLVRTLAL